MGLLGEEAGFKTLAQNEIQFYILIISTVLMSEKDPSTESLIQNVPEDCNLNCKFQLQFSDFEE